MRIQFPVGAEGKGMDGVIVLWIASLGQNRSLRIGNIIAIAINELQNIRGSAYEDSVSKNAQSDGGIDKPLSNPFKPY